MFVLWKTHYEKMDRLKEANASLITNHKEQVASMNRVIEELTRKHDELEKKFNDEKALAYKTMELKFKDEMQTTITNLEKDHRKTVDLMKKEYEDKLEAMRTENFTKLKDSLSKLHEEGNSQTKYLEKISLKMMDVAGFRSSTKQIGANDEHDS